MALSSSFPALHISPRYGGSPLRLWQRLTVGLSSPQHRTSSLTAPGRLQQRRFPLLFVRCSSTSKRQWASSTKKISVPVVVVVEHSVKNAELENVVEQLRDDAPRAVQLVVRGHRAAQLAEETEVSLTICDDDYIRKLNKEWLGKDFPTDVLSFPQDQPPGEAPLLLLGDVVISAETAAQQAEERKHSLLDEMRILLVHGLLHLVGYDHELGAEAKQEMEEKEDNVLEDLGWKGKGLISSSYTPGLDEQPVSKSGAASNARPPYKLLFCDMDGTLLNSQSRISNKTADALKAAIQAGVQVVLATGKTRQAAIKALENAGLVGDKGVVSTSSPGVFIQGLLVYGTGGTIVQKALLPEAYCLEAFRYALEHKIPTVGFSMDTTVSPFDDPFVHLLHEKYMEPKAEILTSLDDLPKYQIQKLLFFADQERIEAVIRPQLGALTKEPLTFTQAQRDMLEVLPQGCSKGNGVKALLEHLGVDPDQVMAVGDGENDIEMLQMVGWGVAMANGAPNTLRVADVTVSSNDQDGVAEAVERFILP